VVYREASLVAKLLRDLLTEEYSAIRIDNEQEYRRVFELIERIMPALAPKVKLYNKEYPIFEEYGVQAEIDRALRSTRVLVRRTAVAAYRHREVPRSYALLCRDLGDAADEVADELMADRMAVDARPALLAVGEATRAYGILTGREFRPWEGGEGEALAAWDATLSALGLPIADPPATLGEARSPYTPPVARHESGETDYFATSLPELLLFTREAL
jgi:hypothetical protein